VEAKLAEMAPGSVQLNILQWNAKLPGCAQAGHYEKTMEVFEQMQQEGMIPNSFTFVQVLNACSISQALEKGRCVHKQIIQGGFESDVFMGNSLVDMYAKCGSIQDAQLVFNRDGHTRCGLMEVHDFGTCEMWARAAGIETVSTNAS
jgi:pentatricopeptide repeat protein